MADLPGEPRKRSAFIAFVLENKAWVLAPALTVVLLLLALAVGSASSVAPFFYTLF